ncbi:MAG TPA: galactonate dehydratase [Propionibacteriaceae bacterium]|nr:galactonate dehydratase [Propionibacteriaceae bacterium]
MTDSVARVETFLVAPRWLMVRVETADGVVGWGEATCEGRAETVRTCVEQLSELLVGQDPSRIADHWQVMTKASFYRTGPILSSAVSGLDQALWDIKGKRLGAPVHELLGGPVRDRVRMYAWVGGDEPGQVAEQVAVRVEQGLTAVKMNGTGRVGLLLTKAEVDDAVARVGAAREALGDAGDVAIDFHGRVSVPSARRLAHALEPLFPMFIEEPTPPDDQHLLAEVVRASSVPVATGERLYARAQFLPVLEAGVRIVQPDLCHAGGISEVMRIGALAETYGALLAPHCPLGPVALAACLQVGFASYTHVIQESSLGIHYNKVADILTYLVDTSVFDIVDGSIERLVAPGLGIDVDEAAVRAADREPFAWQAPLWRHDDGAFAEW